jgi:hypothetical protein
MDTDTKELLKAIVNLLTELSEDVIRLTDPNAWGIVPRDPDKRTGEIRGKLKQVRSALERVH